jgi:cell wall-associated NlpC family hydrolase
MIPREAVVAEARRWLGTPWRHQGRNEHGLDCVGLLAVVCRDLGISDYDIEGYARSPDTTRFLAHLVTGGAIPIRMTDAGPADIMAFRDQLFPCHVGILSEKSGVPHVIHAHAARRKVVEEPLLAELLVMRVGAYAMPGVG